MAGDWTKLPCRIRSSFAIVSLTVLITSIDVSYPVSVSQELLFQASVLHSAKHSVQIQAISPEYGVPSPFNSIIVWA